MPLVNLVERAGEQAAGAFDQTLACTFTAGQPVVISGGPFLGFTGTTVEMVPAGAEPEEIVPLLLRIMRRESLVRIRLADLDVRS